MPPGVRACVVKAMTGWIGVLMEHVVFNRAIRQPFPLQAIRVVHFTRVPCKVVQWPVWKA